MSYQLLKVTDSSDGPDTIFMESYEHMRSKLKPENVSVTNHFRPICLIFNLHHSKLNKLCYNNLLLFQ